MSTVVNSRHFCDFPGCVDNYAHDGSGWKWHPDLDLHMCPVHSRLRHEPHLTTNTHFGVKCSCGRAATLELDDVGAVRDAYLMHLRAAG